MRMSTKTQLCLVSGTRRHPCRVARTSKAGNQLLACESPTSATVTAPFGSPYSHTGGRDPASESPHLSAMSGSSSRRAAVSEGARSRGTGPSIWGSGRGASVGDAVGAADGTEGGTTTTEGSPVGGVDGLATGRGDAAGGGSVGAAVGSGSTSTSISAAA